MSASPDTLTEGVTYEAWYPFKREKYQPHPEPVIPGDWQGQYTDPPEIETWVPGWESEGDGYGGNSYNWHGNGAMLLTVVSLHKPGKAYPERAFYTRQWRDPDGKIFGKKNLRCVSSLALKNWLGGSKTEHLEDERAEVESAWDLPEAGAGYGTASAPRPNVTDPGMNKNPSNVEKQA